MSANAAIPVGIVGAGVIGRTHADAILRHPRLRIAALIDPVAPARQALVKHIAAERGGEPPAQYDTLTEALAGALADDPIQLVAICTPSGLHAEQAGTALAAGRHVVIEKPLDVSLPRAREFGRLAAEAAARGQVTSVISQHRFDPASTAVAGAVKAGRLGRLTSAVASLPWWRSQEYYDSAGWRGTWELDGGGALMNQGVHLVDLLVWLLGTPTEVVARVDRLAHERIEVEDVAVATIRFASGALGVLHATTAAHPGLPSRLQVHGTLGSAVIHDDQLEYLRADGSEQPQPNQAAAAVPAQHLRGAEKPADNFITGHLRQYDDIVGAIEQHRPPGVGVADALLTMALVRTVYLSATLSRPVSVPEVLAGALDDVEVAVRGGEAT